MLFISSRVVSIILVLLLHAATSSLHANSKRALRRFPKGNTDIFDNNVWLMGPQFLDYSTDCETFNFMTLSPDGSVFTFYDLVEAIPEAHFNLTLPGYKIRLAMLNEEQQDEIVVILHEFHMTILRFGTFYTFPIPVKRASSLFVVKNLVCVIPDVTGTTPITCVHAIKRTVKNCSFPVEGGSLGYSDRRPIYNPTPLAFVVESDVVHKFNVSDECLNHVEDSPRREGIQYGEHAWFSSNGTTLFLDTGLTLSAGALRIGPYFNGTPKLPFSYNSFSQSPQVPYQILSLHSDVSNMVFNYSWPQLEQVGSVKIPEPKKVKATIVTAHEVHSCAESAQYAVATYRTEKGELETGVAYLTFF